MARASRVLTVAAVTAIALTATILTACATSANAPTASPASAPTTGQPAGAPQAVIATQPMPTSAYYLDTTLPSWEDTTSHYDTSKQWKLSGGKWTIALFMNPALAPQLLEGMKAGVFQAKLKPLGITPVVEPIDMPPRAFHALQRSKWPFIYVPIAVFMNYVRSDRNEGGAGGLQYVAIAGSMAGAGRTLMTKDPSIKSIADLKGKLVGVPDASTPALVLLADAAAKAGLKVGNGPNDIHVGYGTSSEVLNSYTAGHFQAVLVTDILKKQVASQGSQALTDFSQESFTSNLMILCVERSVLEKRPDVVKAVLEAHYQGNLLAQKNWNTTEAALLMNEWNGYFKTQAGGPKNSQRLTPSVAAYKMLLGEAHPEQLLSRTSLASNFQFMNDNHTWGWPGIVDTTKLVDYAPYNAVLKEHGATKLQ